MHELDFVALFTEPLEQQQIQYMITGSVAAIVYGEPRLTHDIDLVLHLRTPDVAQLCASFPIEYFYCPPSEIILTEMRRDTRAHFNLIHHKTGFKADCYVMGKDPLHHWGMQHRRRITLDDAQAIWLAPPEYVLIRKLQYFQEGESAKHIDDCAKMLLSEGLGINQDFLQRQITSFGLQAVWDKVRTERDRLQ